MPGRRLIFSPRMWRCFLKRVHRRTSGHIFSTYVEVFLLTLNALPPIPGFSPRMWRCFLATSPCSCSFFIFSTYVEVFLRTRYTGRKSVHFLHVCGGVSCFITLTYDPEQFSPRMWRCFYAQAVIIRPSSIFSTYVEVFLSPVLHTTGLLNFLHVCGGVSNWFSDLPAEVRFSPRMWRCFF